jgi:hypothetical protein
MYKNKGLQVTEGEKLDGKALTLAKCQRRNYVRRVDRKPAAARGESKKKRVKINFKKNRCVESAQEADKRS